MPAHDFNQTEHGSMQGSPSVRTAEDPLKAKVVEHVLVPLDGSDFSLAAIPTATALADRFGAKLHAVDIGPHGGAGESHHLV